jgi:hypothetical protein
MIQEIIVYVLVALAVILFVWRLYKALFKKGGKPCDSCTGSCALKDKTKCK